MILLLVPILLDLFLWLGPRISILHFIDDVFAPQMVEWVGWMQEMTAEQLPSVTEAPDYVEIGQEVPETQYWPVMGFPPLVGFSSLLSGGEAKQPPLDYSPPVWTIRSWGEISGLLVLWMISGLVIGTLYITLIGQQVAEGNIHWLRAALRMPRLLLQGTVLTVLGLIFFLVIMLPFALLTMILFSVFFVAGLTNVAFVLTAIMAQIGMILALWFGVFGIFTIHGIIINQRGLLGALWDSIRVVQWNTSGTLILLLLVVLINAGLRRLFQLPDLGSWLAPVAIAAYAFASTALIAATFVFFKDRYRYWREVREQMLAELARRRTQDRTHS